VALAIVPPAGIANPCSFYTEEEILLMASALKCDFSDVAGVPADNVLLESFNTTGCGNIELDYYEKLTVSMLNSSDCRFIKENTEEAEEALLNGGHVGRRRLQSGSQQQSGDALFAVLSFFFFFFFDST
jgi:hypothetical protein